MSPTVIATSISSAFGLVLLLLSVWFLITIDIPGHVYIKDSDYNEWVTERRLRLLLGTTAAVGIGIGLFQFAFSAVFVLANFTEQRSGNNWNLTSMILHIIFVLCTFYGLATGIGALTKAGGSLHIALVVAEGIEVIFLIFYIIAFERECSYFASICRLFTCDELKLKLANASLIKFPSKTPPNIRMERLVEERPSLPV